MDLVEWMHVIHNNNEKNVQTNKTKWMATQCVSPSEILRYLDEVIRGISASIQYRNVSINSSIKLCD